ncbi:MAG: flagellar biosynthesis protein FlhF [Acidobacteria bacterium]|nr:flagellar biosynthesis protein FlhF [Acidobacteriota bacterium]
MMNIRKYRAETTREALELIKRDLGEDAYVLETKRVRTGGFLGLRSRAEVEVSAATSEALVGGGDEYLATPANSEKLVDLKDEAAAAPNFSAYIPPAKDRSLMSALATRAASSADFEEKAAILGPDMARPITETIELNPDAPRFVFPAATKQTAAVEKPAATPSSVEGRSAPISERDIELLRAEMREVKFSLGALAGLQHGVRRGEAIDLGIFGMSVEPEMQNIFNELIAVGIPAELAQRFAIELESTSEAGSARKALMNSLPASMDFEPEILKGDNGAILAVIGSTGVGKTTTAAKLAARAALYDHHRVELVTLDTYRIAAVEQLKTYAEIIGAGCHVVRSVFELDATLCRMPTNAKVIIDTTGRNPHDLADQFEFSDFLQRRPDIRKCLVVQATTHPLDAAAAIKKFEMYGADCIAVTKMDETTRPGAVLETIIDSRLPLAYLAAGQRVPEDLQAATPETLTNRILAFRA